MQPSGPGTAPGKNRRTGSKHRPHGDDHRKSQKGEGLVPLFLIHEGQYATPKGLFHLEANGRKSLFFLAFWTSDFVP